MVRDYQRLKDYALISNCHGSALVARDGSIDWACLERFDGAPSFSRLLDREKGGWFVVHPTEPYEVTRRYLPSTCILETTFTTASGVLTLTDFMLAPKANESNPRLVRILECKGGSVEVRSEYRPLKGFSEGFGSLDIIGHKVWGDGLVCTPCSDKLTFSVVHDRAVAHFKLDTDEQRAYAIFSEDDVASSTPTPAQMMEMAEKTWAEWSCSAVYDGPLKEPLLRSALTLKALTYYPTGAVVAAPTTSLPEQVGGIRNWDYRYCWIRDACLSFYVLKKFGMMQEASDFLDFLVDRAGHNDMLSPLYAIDGETDLSETTVDNFEGWRSSSPVRYGNEAAEQHQSDAYGQVLDLLHMHVRLGGEMSTQMRELGISLANFSAENWSKKDAGLWEPRKPEQQYIHSKIMNWVALDRAIEIFGERENWRTERDRIVQYVHENGIHDDGYYTQYAGGDDVDAAILIAPMVGFPIDEIAFSNTVDVVIDRLGRGELLYRYLSDDGLPGHEGTFVICAFWLVDALAWLGRIDEAQSRFDALCSRKNDLGLYSEEISEDGAFLGNFPQAFSHLAFVHSALILDLYREYGRDGLQGSYADRTLRETSSRSSPQPV